MADFHTAKTDVTADTNTRIYTGVLASGKIKVAFVPSASDPTVIQIAPSEDELDNAAGYPFFIAQDQAVGEADLELAPGVDIWLRSDADGTAYVLSA